MHKAFLFRAKDIETKYLVDFPRMLVHSCQKYRSSPEFRRECINTTSKKYASTWRMRKFFKIVSARHGLVREAFVFWKDILTIVTKKKKKIESKIMSSTIC